MSSAAGPDINTDGLVLYLDAANALSYPGSGTVWNDLSGNNNHFTLFNGVTFSNSTFVFDGVNDYARSTSAINLSGTTVVTVEVVFRVPTVTTNVMVFEHTANWNTFGGAFGAYTNSNGDVASSPTTDNDIHTNSASGRVDFSANNLTRFGNFVFTYRSSTATVGFENANSLSTFNVSVAGVAGYANDFLYIGSRGGSGAFGQMTLVSFKVYNRQLSNTEIVQNLNATRSRFGI